MNQDDVRRLLGGYATGTLTPEERQALLSAALDDQDLFNALADEEALRQHLADPSFRRDLLSSMDERKPPFFAWLVRPAPLALCGSLAVAVLVVVGLRYQMKQTQIASVPPAAVEQARPTAAPPPLPDLREADRLATPVARPARRVAPAGPENRAIPAAPSPAPPPPEPPLRAEAPGENKAKDESAPRDNQLASAQADKKAAAPQSEEPAASIAGQIQQTPGGGLRQRQQIAASRAMQVGEVSKERLDQVSFRMAPPARRVTGVSGATVTLSIGGEQGVKVKDKLVVLRNGNPIGEVEITEVKENASSGTYTGSTGVQIGDLIR